MYALKREQDKLHAEVALKTAEKFFFKTLLKEIQSAANNGDMILRVNNFDRMKTHYGRRLPDKDVTDIQFALENEVTQQNLGVVLVEKLRQLGYDIQCPIGWPTTGVFEVQWNCPNYLEELEKWEPGNKGYQECKEHFETLQQNEKK